jgi:uncharacterized membrane protein YhaH (DUF805 family)
MRHEGKRYWFPAKRYGWGWGAPSAWQGWVVLLAYIVVLSATPFVFSPEIHPFLFGGVVLISSVLLILVCYVKGEPPRWRWGSKDERS